MIKSAMSSEAIWKTEVKNERAKMEKNYEALQQI